MSIYVIGDIHGCYSEFINMLDKIAFCDKDLLILTGDYIDRGKENLEILKWLESKPENVITVMGNHEKEFLDNINMLVNLDKNQKLQTNFSNMDDCLLLYDSLKYYLKSLSPIALKIFDQYNTIFNFIKSGINIDDFIKWKIIFEKMPYYYKFNFNDKKYIVVHAGYSEDKNVETFLYSRKLNGVKDSYIIFGHTPTIIKEQFCYNNGKIYHYYDTMINCNFYNVDCGCFLKQKYENAHLACLRIDDNKEFYI